MKCPLLILAGAILATGRGQDVEAQSECFFEHCGKANCPWWIDDGEREGVKLGRCTVKVIGESLDVLRWNGLQVHKGRQ